jgi:glyoxylase I family protein
VKVHHVAIPVTDLEKSRAFYVDVLGLEEIRRQPHSIWVKAGDTILMLELQAQWLVALAIDESAREAWRDKIHVESETQYTLYTRDPDGNRIALSHYK